MAWCPDRSFHLPFLPEASVASHSPAPSCLLSTPEKVRFSDLDLGYKVPSQEDFTPFLTLGKSLGLKLTATSVSFEIFLSSAQLPTLTPSLPTGFSTYHLWELRGGPRKTKGMWPMAWRDSHSKIATELQSLLQFFKHVFARVANPC